MALTKEEFDKVVVQEEGFDQQVADFMWADRSAFSKADDIEIKDAAEVLTIDTLRKGMPLVRPILQDMQDVFKSREN